MRARPRRGPRLRVVGAAQPAARPGPRPKTSTTDWYAAASPGPGPKPHPQTGTQRQRLAQAQNLNHRLVRSSGRPSVGVPTLRSRLPRDADPLDRRQAPLTSLYRGIWDEGEPVTWRPVHRSTPRGPGPRRKPRPQTGTEQQASRGPTPRPPTVGPQPVNATTLAIASDGFIRPSVRRGRPLSSRATASRWAWLWSARPVPLGTYWRSRIWEDRGAGHRKPDWDRL